MNNVSFDEALALIEKEKFNIAAEFVDPIRACGRVLAEDVFAKNDQPPFPRSPLDGYAFRSEDVSGASPENPAVLKLAGYAPAGCCESFSVGRGECIRIMTGAPIPEDCDAVIGHEDTNNGLDTVEIYKPVGRYGNYVFKGEDFSAGQLLAPSGTAVDAALAASAVSGGNDRLLCAKKPMVSVISTGSELASPGSPLKYGQIYDSNSVYLGARLTELGCECLSEICGDEKEELAFKIKTALDEADMLITTGGVSVGDKDYMPEVLEILGARIVFKGVKMKPGSPLIFAVLNDKPLLCLSGNPYACAATFELFARPIIAKLSLNPSIAMKKSLAELAEDYYKGASVPRFVKARLEDGKLYTTGKDSSGVLYALSGCGCFVRIPEGEIPKAGDELEIYII